MSHLTLADLKEKGLKLLKDEAQELHAFISHIAQHGAEENVVFDPQPKEEPAAEVKETEPAAETPAEKPAKKGRPAAEKPTEEPKIEEPAAETPADPAKEA